MPNVPGHADVTDLDRAAALARTLDRMRELLASRFNRATREEERQVLQLVMGVWDRRRPEVARAVGNGDGAAALAAVQQAYAEIATIMRVAQQRAVEYDRTLGARLGRIVQGLERGAQGFVDGAEDGFRELKSMFGKAAWVIAIVVIAAAFAYGRGRGA